MRVRLAPFIDLVIVSDPAQIHWLNEHPDITRSFDETAGLLQRVIHQRVLRDLRFGAHVLPVFQPREDGVRARKQLDLTRAFDRLCGQPSPELDALTESIHGQGTDEEAGTRAQQWCGRLFSETYRSSAETYRAGRLLARWPSAPPWRTWAQRRSGRLNEAKRAVSDAAELDPHAIHGTSIAMENVARTVLNLRKLARTSSARLHDSEVLRRTLVVPPVVVRTCKREVQAPFFRRPLTRQTLLLFLLGRAYRRTGNLEDAFLSNDWSACPARNIVPDMLLAVWSAARPVGRTRMADVAQGTTAADLSNGSPIRG